MAATNAPLLLLMSLAALVVFMLPMCRHEKFPWEVGPEDGMRSDLDAHEKHPLGQEHAQHEEL